MVRFVLERLGDRCSTATETAKVQKSHLEYLLMQYPRLMDDYLKNTTLSIEYGRFKVSQSLFDGSTQGMPIAVTDNRSIEWQASSDDEAKEFWRRKHRGVRDHLQSPTGTKIEAVAKVICLEDCVLRDEKSVLGHLISAKLSPSVFTSDTVSILVQWQWQRFFRTPFMIATFFHLMATALFSVFVLFVDGDDGSQQKTIGVVALHLCLLVSLPPSTQNFLRPCRCALLTRLIPPKPLRVPDGSRCFSQRLWCLITGWRGHSARWRPSSSRSRRSSCGSRYVSRPLLAGSV